MRLHHTTTRGVLRSVLKRGLLCCKSQGRLKAVWLHAADKTSWAFLHCVKRHGGRIEDVVSIEVDIPDDLVKRSSVDGLFYTLENVDPALLGAVTRFQVVAASPLGDY